MVLLDKTIAVHPEQTKTNVIYDIEVPQDFDKAEIEFSYGPKWITDKELIQQLTLEGGLKYEIYPPETKEIPFEECPEMCNMITISLDMNDKFCGYAHRHDWNQLITISEAYATPGFNKMRPEKGIWRLVLPVCNVVGGDVTVHVVVRGLED